MVSGSTILEVIISMVLIMVVFTIAMMIYANVVQQSLSVQKLKARQVLEKQLSLTIIRNRPEKQVLTIDSLLVEQEIKASPVNESVLEIHLTAFDLQHRVLAEVKKLAIKRDE